MWGSVALLLWAELATPALDEAGGGVICLAPMPAAELMATAGKGASDDTYDDSLEARAERVRAAKRRKPVTYALGTTTSAPVDERRAACLDGVPFDFKQTLFVDGKPLLVVRLERSSPVMWLRSSAFYGSLQLDPVPTRLLCRRRSPTPDCSWCPCRGHRYAPPPRAPGP